MNISYRCILKFCLAITDVTVERTFFFSLIYFPGRGRRYNKTVIKRFRNRRYKYIHFFLHLYTTISNGRSTQITIIIIVLGISFFFPSVSAMRIYVRTKNNIKVFYFFRLHYMILFLRFKSSPGENVFGFFYIILSTDGRRYSCAANGGPNYYRWKTFV